MKKGDIRTWSNARGEGKLFSFDVADDQVRTLLTLVLAAHDSS